jgi:hypothetical protein
VYAVTDTTSGKTVALKQLLPNSSDTARALFEREYQTLATLRHPGIVEVYDYRTDPQGAFYTMELLEGGDLSRNAPIPWRDACTHLRDVASILGMLHARRLVYRDLSGKNLWRSPEGRLKLIDFGALAPFGPSETIVGTPPFIPPEAVCKSALDQRSDLFSLGALGYWLTTGIHAFPAHQLDDLPRLHQRPPDTPSRLLALTGNRSLEPIPPDLDELLMALLKVDPVDRPQNASDLIDRLNSLAALEPEQGEISAQAYFKSKVFVGRDRERARVKEILDALDSYQQPPVTVYIEGEAGTGLSRLLQELTIMARVVGAVALTADARSRDRPFAVASELALGLFNALPDEVMRVARTHAMELARAAPALRERLGVSLQPYAKESLRPLARESERPLANPRSGDVRLRLQHAFKELFLATSRERPVSLFVDDLQAIDEESQRLLAALALENTRTKLLVVTTLRLDVEQKLSVPVASLRQSATQLCLSPLSENETFEMLRSVFGDVPYLERFSQRLHRASEGNPAHCLELVEYLITTGAARYVESSWTLPTELDAALLPSRHEARVARIARLPQEARSLAQLLSIPHFDALSFEHCRAIAELDEARTRATLRVLCESQILRELPNGYRFAREDVREALQRELDPARAARAHLRLAEALYGAAGDNHRELLLASLHLLRGGQRQRSLKLLKRVAQHFRHGELSSLRATVPIFEQIYRLLRNDGADEYALATPITLLAVAGYFVDRRYGQQYGEEAPAISDRLLRLAVFRRLRPFVGGKLALFLALVLAGVALVARRSYTTSFKGAITQLLGMASALNAMAATSVDVRAAARYAELIEPLAVLGRDHVAGVLYDFTRLIARQTSDRIAEHDAETRRLCARLECERPIRDLEPKMKHNFIAGITIILGLHEGWRESPETLVVADRLDGFGPLHKLYADHLRSNYYIRQGNIERAQFHRKRIELHAVQLESSWQVETWGPTEASHAAIQTHDAVLMKRAAQELTRMSADVPPLALLARRAQGNYLVLRGKYVQALPLLDAGEEPLEIMGWAQSRGMLARAYNGLGKFARARQICLDALARLTPGDLDFVVLNLVVQIELALAEAGLGNFTAASEQLDTLIARHTPVRGPLTLGALHEARAKVALFAGEMETCRAHLAKMSGYYRPTGIATLRELVEKLERKLELAEGPKEREASTATRPSDQAERLITLLRLFREQGDRTPIAQRAKNSLQLVIELSDAVTGFIVLSTDERDPVPYFGGAAPSLELVAWAAERLHDATGEDSTTVSSTDVETAIDPQPLVADGTQYCIAPLWTYVCGQQQAVGVIVFGFDHTMPQLPSAAVLLAIAQYLAEAPSKPI